MAGLDDELRTLADFDREIADLNRVRDRKKQLLADPKESDARRRRVDELLGQLFRRRGVSDADLDEVRRIAGEDAWMLDDDERQADGWVRSQQGFWDRPDATIRDVMQEDLAEPEGVDAVDDAGEVRGQ